MKAMLNGINFILPPSSFILELSSSLAVVPGGFYNEVGGGGARSALVVKPPMRKITPSSMCRM